MGRLPSWIIVMAVVALVALAAADALRTTNEGSPRKSAAKPSAPDLRGIVVVGPTCSVTALRLPDLLELRAPRQTDCGGLVWSSDGTLNASCADGYTDVGTSEGRRVARIRGCAPAWRTDGALSVIRDGDLVVTRRRGRPQVFLSREQLAGALAGELERGRSYELVEVAWLDTSSFAAILAGSEPWQRAVIVYAAGALETLIPELGQRISTLRTSPLGNIAFARNRIGREFVAFTRSGEELQLPRIANARTIAWSPDEDWVALATRTGTFFAHVNTGRVIARIPYGGDTLAWLP